MLLSPFLRSSVTLAFVCHQCLDIGGVNSGNSSHTSPPISLPPPPTSPTILTIVKASGGRREMAYAWVDVDGDV